MNLLVRKTWLEARFRLGERGANLVEYLLLLTLLAIVVIAIVRLLGQEVSTKFPEAESEMSGL